MKPHVLCLPAAEIFDNRARHLLLSVTLEDLQVYKDLISTSASENQALTVPNAQAELIEEDFDASTAITSLKLGDQAALGYLFPPGTTLETLNTTKLTLDNVKLQREGSEQRLVFLGEEIHEPSNAVNFWYTQPLTHACITHFTKAIVIHDSDHSTDHATNA